MLVSVKESQIHTVHIPDDVKDSNEKSCNAWIVPAKLNPFLYFNDLQYSEGDNTPRMVKGANERKANVECVQTIVEIGCHISNDRKMWLGTLPSISTEEGLFLDYVNSYQCVPIHRP